MGSLKLLFITVNQAEEWKTFYSGVPSYLETLNINTDAPDQAKKELKQVKMMFTGEDRQALQTLLDNGTITLEIQQATKLILNAIQKTIKEAKFV